MANFNKFSCLAFLLVAINVISVYGASGKVFEPIQTKFPDTKRSAQQAAEYVQTKMAGTPKASFGAKKDDTNLVMTGESCARGLGSTYNVKTDAGEQLYSVCFNDDKASAIYSTHSIDLAGKEAEHSKHGSFRGKYTLYGQHIDELYEAGPQTKTFDALLGTNQHLTDANTKKCNYFSRNHLTPHADFSTAATQALTYYFQNCFPGKQSMNAENWGKVEDFVRDISVDMGKKLKIFTGVYGILKKNDKAGNSIEIYLNPEQHIVEVPLIVWKLVIDEKTNEAVTFFTSNDTDMDDKAIEQFSTLCNSVCDDLGYNFNKNATAGYTLCCKYEDFAKQVKFLPVQLKTPTLLKNTKYIEKKAARGQTKSNWGKKPQSAKKDDDTPAPIHEAAASKPAPVPEPETAPKSKPASKRSTVSKVIKNLSISKLTDKVKSIIRI